MIHYLLREFTMNSLSVSWIHSGSIIPFANSLRTHNLFCEFTILFVISIWINNFFRKFTMKSESFSRFTMDPLSVPRIYYEFTILFAISICINYYNREFTMKSLAFSRFTTNSLWILQFFRKSIILFLISNWYYQYWYYQIFQKFKIY